MSLQLIQEPTNHNAAYTRLLYTVSGSIYTDQPQYQYVCDVYSGSTLLKRMTQPVNPVGTSTFDVARVLQGELSVDYNWKTSSVTEMYSSSKTFRVKLGEQFATSISSSVTIYPDQTNDPITVNQSIVEPNAGTYNLTPTKQVLSNMPSTMSMQSDDFGTISIYNDQGTYISQSFYSASAASYVKVDEKNYTKGGGAYFNAVPISSSANYWNYVDVSISSSYGTENYRYEASDETHREKTRFAFVNKLGAWDYYNNYNPVRQAINVSREQYTAPRVDYSSRLSTYDISRRGLKDYHNSTDDIFTVDTDLLDKTNANWLEELIESPEVYIQRNGEFIPIVITDSSYVANQNQARQKQFKYTINFKPSNQPFGTWIPEYVNCPQIDDTGVPFNVLTYTPSDITSVSAILSGSLGDSGSAILTEVGFVYNSQSADIPVKGGAGVTQIVGSPTHVGQFSSSISLDAGFTPYKVRAYADNSLGTSYGNTVSFNSAKTAFDPTLDGTLTSQLWGWFDFADTGSMVMDGNSPIEIQSKGTYTGSIYNNRVGLTGSPNSASVEYNSAGYTAISGGIGYSVNSNPNDLYDYDTIDWDPMYTGSTFTSIVVSENFNGPQTTTTYATSIFFSPRAGINDRQYYQVYFNAYRNTGVAFPTGSQKLQSYLSTETANNGISSSYQQFDYAVNSTRYVVYNYSGSNGTDIWESKVMRTEYLSASNDYNIMLGRNSSDSVTFNNEGMRGTNVQVGFLVYNENTTNSLNVSQLLIYTGSLSDSQIDSVIDNLKVSNTITFGDKINAVNN